jgi:hypothetical protein
MSWFKCSLLVLVFSSSAFAQRFSSDECLKGEFEASIKHEGKFFGLLKNKLTIKKNHCLIDIKFENILETKWLIDICREPIHIKVHSKGSQSVYKRKAVCEEKDTSDFCIYWGDLNQTLQDYGLIFADGERESLTTDHGRTYCTYILLKKYLNEGQLFSKYDESINLFGDAALKSDDKAIVVEGNESKEEITPTIEEFTLPVDKSIEINSTETAPADTATKKIIDPKEEARF